MCPRCGTPVGTFVNPDDATFSTYLPVGYLYTPSPGASGAASIPQVAASAGDPAGGWNWGAALLGPLWAIAHRVWWYVGAVAVLGLLWGILIVMALATPNSRLFDSDAVGLLTLLSLGMAFGLFLAMGARGNALAWKSGRYASLEACRQTQRVWALWALGVFGVGILLLLAVLLPLLFTAVATTS